MGVLNVTPDSFSDGGKFGDTEAAVRHALEMLDAGAAIIDIGGESTRPGAKPVSVEDELARVVPVTRRIKEARPDAIVSVDTTKPEVARAAFEAGADMANDVRGAWETPSGIPSVAAEFQAGLIIMHSRGTPETMRGLVDYGDVVAEVAEALAKAAERAIAAGVPRDAIIVDPGIGFAKDTSGNLELMARAAEFAEIGFPVLVGPSRKTFIGEALNPDAPPAPEARNWGTAGAVAWLAALGIDFVRVHDVAAMRDVVAVVEAIRDH